MPKRYQREAIETAYGYYVQGLNAEEIARRMRSEGYPTFSVFTLTSRQPDGKGKPKGWIHRYDWEESRAKTQAVKMHLAEACSDLEDHILADYTAIRGKLVDKVQSATIDREDLQLLLRVDDLILGIERSRKARETARDRLRETRDMLEEMVNYLKQIKDRDALSIIQDHLEGFTDYVRKKYAA